MNPGRQGKVEIKASQIRIRKEIEQARPSGLVVKFCAFHFGILGSVPRYRPTPLICQWPCCGGSSHTKEEDWQEMLARGKSSSAKRKSMVLLYQQKNESKQQFPRGCPVAKWLSLRALLRILGADLARLIKPC